jgi:RNA polymerase sigma-70 factor (ECF subfamily)
MKLLDFWSGLARPSEAAAPPSAEQVFRRHAPRLYSLARRMTGNEADAEDVVGDVLVAVLRKLDTFRGESALLTWLHRVTVNAALAQRRKKAHRRERQLATPPDASGGEGPEQQVIEGETRQAVEGAIASLPETYRDVVVLADVEQLPNADIGELLGLSLPAVKSRLHRARLLMRQALASYV